MELALGTMNFGGRTNERESLAIVRRALESGITLLDTANVYGDGASERIVAKAPADAKIATKVGLKRIKGKPEGLAPARIRAALQESLANLKRPFVDLYYLHAPDPNVPLGETIDALGELLREGLIKRWGMSNYASWEILEAATIAEKKGIPGPAASQVLYNLVIRQLDVEYFRFVERHPIHTTVYNALAGGLLSGRHRRDGEPEKGSRFDGNAMYRRRYWTDRMFALLDAYTEIAKSEGMDLVALAYAWLAQRKGIDSILVGPATVAQLDAALEGCKKSLSDASIQAIERVHQEAQGTDARYAR
jgi:aryl-alcohol dehydrogenase-like predicted oxidoreductase